MSWYVEAETVTGTVIQVVHYSSEPNAALRAHLAKRGRFLAELPGHPGPVAAEPEAFEVDAAGRVRRKAEA